MTRWLGDPVARGEPVLSLIIVLSIVDLLTLTVNVRVNRDSSLMLCITVITVVIIFVRIYRWRLNDHSVWAYHIYLVWKNFTLLIFAIVFFAITLSFMSRFCYFLAEVYSERNLQLRPTLNVLELGTKLSDATGVSGCQTTVWRKQSMSISMSIMNLYCAESWSIYETSLLRCDVSRDRERKREEVMDGVMLVTDDEWAWGWRNEAARLFQRHGDAYRKDMQVERWRERGLTPMLRYQSLLI